SRLSFYLLLLPLHLHSFPTRRSSDLPAALAGAAPACAPRVLVRSDEPDAAAADLLRRSEQGGVLLWRAREGFRARLGMVRLRHHLCTSLGDAARDPARVRARYGAGAHHRPVASAGAHGIGAAR